MDQFLLHIYKIIHEMEVDITIINNLFGITQLIACINTE